jgi:hypothetical protein
LTVSEAKLLLLRAQDAVQEAQAQLGRALGSEQAATYQLAEEPLPTAVKILAQLIGGRNSFL